MPEFVSLVLGLGCPSQISEMIVRLIAIPVGNAVKRGWGLSEEGARYDLVNSSSVPHAILPERDGEIPSPLGAGRAKAMWPSDAANMATLRHGIAGESRHDTTGLEYSRHWLHSLRRVATW